MIQTNISWLTDLIEKTHKVQGLNVKPPLLLWRHTQAVKGSSNIISLEKPRARDWLYPPKERTMCSSATFPT